MKLSPKIIFTLLFGLLNTSPNAQEVATKWNVEIPAPITVAKAAVPIPKPAPVDFKVLSSRTTRIDVKESAEMPDLPPITGTINVTVQLVEDPNLFDPLPPLPVLSPTDPAVIARLAELRKTYRSTTLLFLSATVYDNKRTLLRIFPNGRVDQSIQAWSNVDFKHFSGFSTYRVTDGVDGTTHDFGFLMGIGGIDTRRWKELAEARGIEYKGPAIPEIPKMPDLVDGGPAFVLVSGDPKSPAMDALEQIHDLYRKEGARMEEAYYARIKARAERKAYLLANPPQPKDVTVQFWKRNTPSPMGVKNLEGEGQP